ncbi:MAG: DUF6745 domain-containing protein [Cyanobacteria bacterium P01_A01_bin.83]
MSNEPINSTNATVAIQNIYQVMGKRKPIIELCSSPQNAIVKIISNIPKAKESSEILISQMTWQKWILLGIKAGFKGKKIRSSQQKNPLNRLMGQLSLSSDKFLEDKIADLIPQDSQTEEDIEVIYQAIKLRKGKTEQELNLPDRNTWKPKIILDILTTDYLPNEAKSQLYDEFWTKSDEQIKSALSQQDISWVLHAISQFQNQSLACTASWLDFCFSALNLPYNQKKWQAFLDLVRECGWILAYNDVCFICDRPRKLLFDSNNLLHSETEAAIQFSDGFDIWVNHGTTSTET